MLLFWLVDWWPRSTMCSGVFWIACITVSSATLTKTFAAPGIAGYDIYVAEESSENQQLQNRYTISGYIYEKGSRETLIGANVIIAGTRLGTTSNNYGFYSITLPADTIEVVFSYVGYAPEQRTLFLQSNIQLDIELTPSIELAGVEISAERTERISQQVQMSRIDLPVFQAKTLPALLGEKDIFKVLQLLPGVQKGQEGTSGFYVRGGGPDQNLVVLDDAIVYNASHLFGFFSIFNGDAIKNVQLYKGGFPARFGGRLSSVLDISMKDGSKEKIQGEAGIGLISSRLTLEGPILKDKSSFLISGRRTYLDALIRPFMDKDERGGYYFYDLNAKANYDLDRKNKFYASGYFGRDKFYFRSRSGGGRRDEGGLFWQNATTTLRWNHLFNDKLFANTSLIYSDYTLKIYMDEKHENNRFNLSYSSGIEDLGIKHDISWHPSPNHMVRAGVQSIYHRFTPSAVVMRDDYNSDFISEVETIKVLESGIYIEDEIRLGDVAKINPGLRISHFQHKDKSYVKPEPRISLLYFIRPDLSWKNSYAAMNQYVHLLSSTGIGLPTDLWIPSTANIKPQSTWQVASGLSKDFIDLGLELSMEGYYKKSDNTIGYRPGASFLLLNDPTGAEQISWEDNITSGQGWAYGVELFAQKKSGRLSGWIGYTLSWTQLQFEEINQGKRYYARYDRRHDISIVGIYELRPSVTLSATWVYATGNAMNLPIAEYPHVTHNPWGEYGDGYFYNISTQGTPFNISPWDYINDYGQMNDFRAAAYHRLDIGAQFNKKTTLFGTPIERIFDLSVYNAYNRMNPFFYYMESQPGRSQLKQVTIFPIIPSLSLTIKF